MVNRYVLGADEITQIQSLLSALTKRHNALDDDFLTKAHLYAHDLPRGVKEFLNDFKYLEPDGGGCIVSGFPIDEEKVGPTPAHWNVHEGAMRTFEEEMLFVLYSSLLGDLVSWATQQNGRLIHNVMPIREYEDSQLGNGSAQKLWWHIEDAFHPYRGDYVGLMCLRNPDQIPTTIGCVSKVEIGPEHLDVLFKPHFKIRPDESHDPKNNVLSGDADPTFDSFERISEMNNNPPPFPVLFGSPDSPYVRIDPFYMLPPETDEAQAALDALINGIEANLVDVLLAPGDYLFIDNFRTVHGRKSFAARYDGKDRWLKRVNITRDMRKSRPARPSCSSPVIY